MQLAIRHPSEKMGDESPRYPSPRRYAVAGFSRSECVGTPAILLKESLSSVRPEAMALGTQQRPCYGIGGTRTLDLALRRRLLYPTEPQPQLR